MSYNVWLIGDTITIFNRLDKMIYFFCSTQLLSLSEIFYLTKPHFHRCFLRQKNVLDSAAKSISKKALIYEASNGIWVPVIINSNYLQLRVSIGENK